MTGGIQQRGTRPEKRYVGQRNTKKLGNFMKFNP